MFAAISSITYPAINAIISMDADKSRQGQYELGSYNEQTYCKY